MTQALQADQRQYNIPIMTLERQYQRLQPQLEAAALDVLRKGLYILGPQVKAFEADMASYLGVNHAIGVANGTDALVLALKALGIGPGDEVITTCLSYIATSEAIVRCNATPVFVDLDPAGTYNLNVSAIEAKLTPRTKALLPVHLYGQPADMTALLAVAKQHGLYVVEDCAQAIGATWNGQKVGSFGDVSCFSFFPSKNLGAAGDGGLVATNDEARAQYLRQLRVHGQNSAYDHAHEGINSRLDELQAALLAVKLPHIDTWNQQRRDIAARYTAGLQGVAGLTLPVVRPEATPIYHQYTLRLPTQAQRDALLAYLQTRGVGARIYYPMPLHLQGMHRGLGLQPGHCPLGEVVAHTVLSLPMFPELTDDEQAYIVATVKEGVAQA